MDKDLRVTESFIYNSLEEIDTDCALINLKGFYMQSATIIKGLMSLTFRVL